MPDSIRNNCGESDEAMHTITISDKENNLQSLEHVFGTNSMPNSLPYWEIDDYTDPDSFIGIYSIHFNLSYHYHHHRRHS